MINLINADRILKQLYLSMVTEELNKTKEQPKTKPVSLYEARERGCRGKRAECSFIHDGTFVELLNKEMEELLESIENNEELKKLLENNSNNSKGVENEKERN